MDWFRSYHGAPTDAKWLLVGRKAGVAPGMVAAVWWALMDHASQSRPRGCVEGFDTETLAETWGWDERDIESVVSALYAKKMITAEHRLATWDKRQPKREDPTAAERKRRQRDRESVGSHAPSRTVTPEQSRTDESRIERKSPPTGGQKERKSPTTRSGPLPGSWQPNSAHTKLAASEGVKLEREAEKFRDHATATGRRQLDWDAAFRNWLRKAGEDRNGRTHGSRSDAAPRPAEEGSPRGEGRYSRYAKG
jgi:hypothetical protein